jgi:hypothetical protein
MNSENAEDVNHSLSRHSFIVTYFICTNLDCKTYHIEETDSNGNLLYFGPMQMDREA